MEATPSTRKSLGLAACTAVVVGNMVGSGFYLSPSAVAPYGVLAIFTIYGCGPTAVLYGLILLLLGIPVYVWQRHRAASS